MTAVSIDVSSEIVYEAMTCELNGGGSCSFRVADLANMTGLGMLDVFDALRSLVERGLVERVTPSSRYLLARRWAAVST